MRYLGDGWMELDDKTGTTVYLPAIESFDLAHSDGKPMVCITMDSGETHWLPGKVREVRDECLKHLISLSEEDAEDLADELAAERGIRSGKLM